MLDSDRSKTFKRLVWLSCLLGGLLIALGLVARFALPATIPQDAYPQAQRLLWSADVIRGTWVRAGAENRGAPVEYHVIVQTSAIPFEQLLLGVPIRYDVTVEHSIEFYQPESAPRPSLGDAGLLARLAHEQLMEHAQRLPLEVQQKMRDELTLRMMRNGDAGPRSTVFWPGVAVIARSVLTRHLSWCGLLLLLVAGGAMAWHTRMLEARRRNRLCLRCGYPLLGVTPDGRVVTTCSECGRQNG